MYRLLKSNLAIDLAFFFLVQMFKIFKERINILENLEFVVSRKEFRFMMEIFYLTVNKFKYIGNSFGQFF